MYKQQTTNRIGYLPNTNSARIKQGLDTQVISSQNINSSTSLYPSGVVKLDYNTK